MRIEIDIPEKEFGVEIADHFQCFFERIRAEIKERLISNDTLVCGNYELETAEMLLKSFKNAKIEQEPKTGHWEFVGDNCYRCTKCGEVYATDQFYAINNYCDNRFPKGCPNCGCRMEK